MEAAPEPEAGAALTIHDLPDALLARIVEQAGPPARQAAACVNRRWHGALYAAPEVWRVTHLRFRSDPGSSPEQLGAMLAGKRRLLERQAALVQVLVLSGSVDALGSRASPPCALADLLSCLSPDRLTAVHLMSQDISAADVAQLQRYPRLEHLRIAQRQEGLPTGLDPAVLAEVAGIPSLRAIAISAWALPALQPLTALTDLEHLQVREASSYLATKFGCAFDPVDVPQAGAFPKARHTELAAYNIQANPDVVLSSTKQNGVCSGPAELCITGKPSVCTCDNLTLTLRACHDGMLDSGSLLSVLQAALPPAVPLRTLGLGGCAVTGRTFEGSTQLATATQLILRARGPGLTLVNPLPSFGRLLALTPALQQLHFQHCELLAGLPATVTGLTQLRELCAQRCSVRDIPAGPYLSGLALLDLQADPNGTDPTMKHLPAALESATELRTLDLSYHYALKLDAAATDLLAAVPRLQQLKLSGVRVQEAFRGRLAERRPDVQLLTS